VTLCRYETIRKRERERMGKEKEREGKREEKGERNMRWGLRRNGDLPLRRHITNSFAS